MLCNGSENQGLDSCGSGALRPRNDACTSSPLASSKDLCRARFLRPSEKENVGAVDTAPCVSSSKAWMQLQELEQLKTQLEQEKKHRLQAEAQLRETRRNFVAATIPRPEAEGLAKVVGERDALLRSLEAKQREVLKLRRDVGERTIELDSLRTEVASLRARLEVSELATLAAEARANGLVAALASTEVAADARVAMAQKESKAAADARAVAEREAEHARITNAAACTQVAEKAILSLESTMCNALGNTQAILFDLCSRVEANEERLKTLMASMTEGANVDIAGPQTPTTETKIMIPTADATTSRDVASIVEVKNDNVEMEATVALDSHAESEAKEPDEGMAITHLACDADETIEDDATLDFDTISTVSDDGVNSMIADIVVDGLATLSSASSEGIWSECEDDLLRLYVRESDVVVVIDAN